MPPLTRQQTFVSVRSWWSDRNPNLRYGPTINLHAAAKPLIKLLYNRQALEFISNNRGIPLTSTAAEIYGSYLLCEYVLASTKFAILKEILQRTHSEPEALTIQSNMFHDILKLFELPATMDAVLMILVALAQRDATAAATCSSLVALLCDSDVPQVIDGALSILSDVAHFKFPPATTEVSGGAKLLARLGDILQNSPTTERSQWILQIVSNLARDENPNLRGPTISLHGALKPIMKLLNNQRAVDFITNNKTCLRYAPAFGLTGLRIYSNIVDMTG
ncbi:hypothetical protein C8J57DRAFT_1578784 [Mycena rebaudengoi]|nr:hypothetical protein C8J57DRAFT_1578784 [Mycena rebaudengoi]